MNSHVGNVDSLQADDIAGAQSLYGPPGIPVNDNFANAITISLGSTNTTTVTGFNTNATKETGEPNHAGNSGGHSVWWKWSAPADGNVTLDTKGSYSDTTLGVYAGSSVSTLTTIASNDDIKDGVIQASSLTFTATGGTTYYFAVDGFNAGAANGGADSSAITLNLNFTATGSPVPVITAQPASQTIVLGGTASFSVTATTATGTLTYQWNFNGTAIPGATASTYSFASAQASNAGNYSVTVTNSAGSITSSNATLTITAPPPAPPKSSGGGGGGAPSLWFYLGLSLLGFSRRLFRSRR
jgi:hypothetical protein